MIELLLHTLVSCTTSVSVNVKTDMSSTSRSVLSTENSSSFVSTSYNSTLWGSEISEDTNVPSLTDCERVAILAKGVGMDKGRPEKWNLILQDCCQQGTGVGCNNGIVHVIDWSGLFLGGTIVQEGLPKRLLYLYLGISVADLGNENRLTGTIPRDLPPFLQGLDLSHNNLFGTLPNLPDTLIEGIFSNNLLNGTLPQYLPSNINTFLIDGNLMSGPLPEYYPDTLTKFSIGSKYPRGKNRFTGGVYLNAPFSFYCNYNYVTDVQFNDLSALDICDISNTPMLEHAGDSSLQSCIATNLYSASSLPVTASPRNVTRTVKPKSSTTTISMRTGSPSSRRSSLSTSLKAKTISKTTTLSPAKHKTTSITKKSSTTKSKTALNYGTNTEILEESIAARLQVYLAASVAVSLIFY
eukprot:NODE_359_length_10180_cov_0.431703.p2 type:complete len:411 gc:universal NODE_359_length_10180_cov_0.431703:1862-3094(+)